MVHPDRTAHDAYERRHREVDSDTRERLAEVADVLGLEASLRSAFIATCLKAAQFHAADYALVDHELRSGRSWPGEDRLAHEGIQARQWEAFMDQLRATITPRTSAESAEPASGETGRYQVRYRPISSISRKPGSG
jgi:primosomal protein N''